MFETLLLNTFALFAVLTPFIVGILFYIANNPGNSSYSSKTKTNLNIIASVLVIVYIISIVAGYIHLF